MDFEKVLTAQLKIRLLANSENYNTEPNFPVQPASDSDPDKIPSPIYNQGQPVQANVLEI